MIEGRQDRCHISTGIDVHQNVSLHAYCPFGALQPRQGLGYVRECDPVPVGKKQHGVTRIYQWEKKNRPVSQKRLIQLCGSNT